MVKTPDSHSISKKPYVIWFWFSVHMCKMMVSPVMFFYFFKILVFWVSRGKLGVWGGGGGQNDKKPKITPNYQFQSATLYISELYMILSRFLVHRCKIMIYPGVFLYFFKKYNVVNIKILVFFIGPIQQFFFNK